MYDSNLSCLFIQIGNNESVVLQMAVLVIQGSPGYYWKKKKATRCPVGLNT